MIFNLINLKINLENAIIEFLSERLMKYYFIIFK